MRRRTECLHGSSGASFARGRVGRMGNGCGYRAEKKAFRPFLYSKRLGDDLSADMVIAAVCRLEELGWSQS